MYCKKCGFNLKDDDYKCPFCGSSVKKDDDIIAEQAKPTYERVESSNYRSNYAKVEETEMESIRNSLGYVNLKTQFWHHLLIACIGYILIYVLSYVISPILIQYFETHKLSFDCYRQSGDWAACPVEVHEQYNLVSSLTQVICELVVIVAVALIFIKSLKTFFKEFKNKRTWKWFGLALCIMYGGAILYSTFLTTIGYEAPTNENQDLVNNMIYQFPLLGFLFVVVAAPLFEEIIFRFGVFRTFTSSNKKVEIVGLVITTILFAGIHMLATVEAAAAAETFDWALFWGDMASLPIYLIGSFGLTFAYYKSKNLATTMLAHMTYNALSFMAILRIGAGGAGEAVEAIINLLTGLF